MGAWFLEVQARIVLDLVSPWPGAAVLDVGGGHAQLALPLVEAGYDVTVQGSAESCRERVRGLVDAGRARFTTGALARLPWPDRSFDVVLAFRLLPHLSGWRDVIGELCRLARRAVIVDYPTLRSVNAVSGALFGLKKGVEGDTRPFLVFRDREIEDAFRSGGLSVAARRGEFVLPMALHRALGVVSLSRGLESAGAALGLRQAFGSPVILRAERHA